MPSPAILRRPSDLAHDFIRAVAGKLGVNVHKKLRQEDARRSRSTGDLDQADYMLLSTPTTSSGSTEGLPPHFDDLDRVPMKFGPHGAKLLPQTVANQKLLVSGEPSCSQSVPTCQLHLAQLWFYPELSATKAESILDRTGFADGSFIVRSSDSRHFISVCSAGRVSHIPVVTTFRRGEPRFRIDLDKSFSNLVELVEHYKKHKGYVLEHRLKHGIARGIRVEKRADGIMKEKRTSI